MKDLIKQLRVDFPDISLIEDVDFFWSPSKQTVFFNTQEDNWQLLLLHELGHYSLGHFSYTYDIELLKMEVAAWQVVRDSLSIKYNVSLDEDFIESIIDSYRLWLQKRSTCPSCSSIGTQTKAHQYHCVECSSTWKVNPAKKNSLRRQLLK